MRHTLLTILIVLATISMKAQTLNVVTGNVTTQFPATQTEDMVFSNNGTKLTICEMTYNISDIDQIYIDESNVKDNNVGVTFNGTSATVYIAGNVAPYVTAEVKGAHVSLKQSAKVSDDVCGEIEYTLSGSSDDGELYMTGSYKATFNLSGLTLTNQTPVYSGAAICIMDGKRVDLSVKNGTTNNVTDAAKGSQKAAIYCKGHLEIKGKGTLFVNGRLAHGIKSGEYMTMKNCTVNIQSALKDGISVNEYFLLESGTLNISGTGDDGIQCDIDGTKSTGETKDHEDEDSGNIYILDGTLTISVTADAAKGMKAGGDVTISGGKVTINQTGSVVVDEEDEDIDYSTSIKADGNVSISGGTITINNTADGGKGISADGTVTIDEADKATTTIDIKANGIGSTVENVGTGSTETESYNIYVTLPGGQGGQGGGNAWRNVYLYKSDGTLVEQLTKTVTKSNGYSNVTFYYYDFGAADSETYYFKADDYTSGRDNTTYTIVSETFSGPASGSDIYYSITNSYTTSSNTRTYKLTNVTSTYTGSDESAEDEGTGYNAIGIKADGDMTIAAGTITIANSGAMSKSLKSKATLTITGGDITLTPSGKMKVINSDPSYSIGAKTDSFVQNGGTLTINASGEAGRGISANTITTNGGTINIANSGEGVEGTNDDYTAKGMKANTSVDLLGGDITITMTGSGGKGIKSKGTYTQGIAGGSGPTLTIATSGNKLGSSSGNGGGMGPGGMGPGGGWGQQTSGGGSAKGIKVQGTIAILGGTTEISTKTNGAEGLESKVKAANSIVISGGQHYFACYDDCINSAGAIVFDGGTTVCYSNGNDAIDSNYGTSGAITIGDGTAFAYTTRGAPEEGFDCDNNSYVKITGNGIGISAGGAQGGSSSSSIAGAAQGYKFVTSTISYTSGKYYVLSDESGNNLVTYSFPASLNSTLALFTAKGMVKDSTYYVKATTSEPTDATTAWHGLYLGSSVVGTDDVISFKAQ